MIFIGVIARDHCVAGCLPHLSEASCRRKGRASEADDIYWRNCPRSLRGVRLGKSELISLSQYAYFTGPKGAAPYISEFEGEAAGDVDKHGGNGRAPVVHI